MACSIDFDATLQLLSFFVFPCSDFYSVGDVIEAIIILDKQVVVEVGCPVAPFVAMQEYSENRSVRLDYGHRLLTGWYCLCRQSGQ